MQALFLGAAVLASAATAAPVSESAGVATTEISGIGCNVFFNGDGLLATSTTDECNPVATALNKLDGVSNVTCHYIDSMQPHYDHVFGAGTKENCDATARALNKLNATLEVGCVADYPNPGLFLAVHVGGGVFQCTAAAARLTAILQAGDTVCKDTEFCCPAAKRCLTPTEMCWPPGCTLESCSSDAECGRGNVCCPLTKICVTPGAACASPCADQGSYVSL